MIPKVWGRFDKESPVKKLRVYPSRYQNKNKQLQRKLDLNCNQKVWTDKHGLKPYFIRGMLSNHYPQNSKVIYWAAAQLNKIADSSEVAYFNTINRGVTQAKDGLFSFKMAYPAQYYESNGRLVLPHVHFMVCGSPTIYTATLTPLVPQSSNWTWVIIIVLVAFYLANRQSFNSMWMRQYSENWG